MKPLRAYPTLSLVLISLLFLVSSSVYAAKSMRCQTQLIEVGDSLFTVKKRCGEPRDKETIVENIPMYNQYGYLYSHAQKTVTYWVYQRSNNEFQYTLRFEDTKLKSIDATRAP